MKICLLDYDILLYLNCFSAMSKGFGELEQVKGIIDDSINDILKSVEADGYIGFLTGEGNFRYKYYPEYKANRKDKDKPVHYSGIRQYMMDRWKAVDCIGMEADDAISLCAAITPLIADLRCEWLDSEIIICTTDKDFVQIGATLYNPVKQEIMEISEDIAELHFWSSMIIGDNSDNIKCLYGKGEKFAQKLLEGACKEDYPALVLSQYYINYGYEEGQRLFLQNYLCLRLLKRNKYFKLPKIIKYGRTDSAI